MHTNHIFGPSKLFDLVSSNDFILNLFRSGHNDNVITINKIIATVIVVSLNTNF